MEVIKKYIDSITIIPIDLELFQSLLSNNLIGVLIRNEKTKVLNKEKFVGFLEKKPFFELVKESVCTNIGDNIYTVRLISDQTCKDSNGNLTTHEVEDCQTYKVENDKITFILYQLDVRNVKGLLVPSVEIVEESQHHQTEMPYILNFLI